MPNDEHIVVLRRGAAAWNAWRAERDEAPDLYRAGLRGLDLSGFNLSRADLRSQRNEFEPGEPVRSPFGGGEPFQSSAGQGRPFRRFPTWSPIPELRAAGPYPELAIGVPR